MAGIRVHHPTHRSGMYTVECPRPYGVPYACPICHHIHVYKAHHIQLDDGGNGMVSQGVYEELRAVGMAGLVVTNEVAKPPPLRVGGDPWNGKVPVIGRQLIEED